MREIDWSKAPAGTTHYQPNINGWRSGWIMAVEGKVFFWHEKWLIDDATLDETAIPRPSQTQWRGPEDGLPPVGAEVEAWIENRKVWAKVTVLAVDVDTVVWRNETDRRSYIGTHVNDLRPLKSDKERAVDAAMKVMPYPGSPSTRPPARLPRF